MKRNSFLKLFASLSSVIAFPFSGFAWPQAYKRDAKGFKVDAGKDRFEKQISLLEGDTFYTKVSTKDTEGDMYAYESNRVKKGGPALHMHYNQDEWWYVLEGEFLIKVGDKTYEVKTGDSAFGPRGIPHTFAKVSEGNARLLMIFQPAGKMEEFFIALSEGKPAKMSPAEQDDFRKLHGFERVGPAINYQKG